MPSGLPIVHNDMTGTGAQRWGRIVEIAFASLVAVRTLLISALLLATAALSLLDVRDFDYWWHLKTGELILATGEIPKVDTYTISVPGARYVDVHWLFQIGIYLLHRAGGHAANVVLVFFVFVATVACSFVAAQRSDRTALSVLCLFLGLLAASDRMMPRPEIATILFLSIELLLLETWLRRGGRALGCLPPLLMLWANLHGLYAIGLGVIAIVLFGEILDAMRERNRAIVGPKIAKLAAVLLFSIAACLVNPQGIDLLEYPLQQLQMIGTSEQRQAGPRSMELTPLIRWRTIRPQVLVGFGLLGLLAATGAFVAGSAFRARYVLLGAVFGVLAILAQRNTALFLPVGALVAIRGWSAFLDRHPPPVAVRRYGTIGLAASLVAFSAFVWSGCFHLRIGDLREPGLSIVRPLYPIGAAEWIARNRPPGPIYHHMADGAYLIYRLYPDYPVLSDGRLEVFGPKLHDLTGTTVEDFRRLDQSYHFGLALLNYGYFDYAHLMRVLSADPLWRLVFVDEASVLFARIPREGSHWPKIDLGSPELFPPLPETHGITDLMLRIRRARLHAILGPIHRAMSTRTDLDVRYPGFVIERNSYSD